MMPTNTLSTTAVPGDFLYPDNLEGGLLRDYEYGGIALQDPSEGLRYQVWTVELVGDDVVLSAPNTPQIVQFTRSDITELSLTFDHNMNPTIAFVQAGVAKFWWFDTVLLAQVFTTLPVGSTNPRVAHDDKRAMESNTSDVMLAYVRSGNLYTRMQRDRYTIEYLQATGVTLPLRKIGMTDKNRLQFQFGLEPEDRSAACV